MPGYIRTQDGLGLTRGQYYDGECQPGDLAAPMPPPSAGAVWNFTTNAWAVPTPQADLAGLQIDIHKSTEFTVQMVVDLYKDPNGNGSALFTLAEVALLTGDWSHVQTVYNALKATPPPGWTQQNVIDLGTLAVARHLPINP